MTTAQRPARTTKGKSDPTKANPSRGARTPSRENILQVASRLLVKASYAEVTIEDIAEKANVNRALVYYYFKNKAFLFHEVACRAISSHAIYSDPIVASDLSPREKLKQLVISHLKWRLNHPEIGAITTKDVKSLPSKLYRDYVALRDKYEAMFRKVISEGVANGEFRQGNSKLLSALTLGLINSIDKWYKPKGELSIDEIAAEAWSYVSAALEPTEAETEEAEGAMEVLNV